MLAKSIAGSLLANERVGASDPMLEVIFWLGVSMLALLAWVAFLYFQYRESVGLCTCPCHQRHDNWVEPTKREERADES